MELILTRIAKRKIYTIGKLYIVERIDDEYLTGTKQTYFCDTLTRWNRLGAESTCPRNKSKILIIRQLAFKR